MAAGAVVTLVLALYIYSDYQNLAVLGVGFASAYLPFALVSPIAGALTDRWGQRRALLVSNVGTLASAVALALLLIAHILAMWQAITLLLVVIVLKALQLAALESSVPLLVPKRHYGRVNASRMLLSTTSAMMGPVLAGLLVRVFDPAQGVLVTGGVILPAILVASVVRIPAAAPAGAVAPTGSLRTQVAQEARCLWSACGLRELLGFLGAISIIIGFLELAVQQMVTGFASEADLVLTYTIGWAGILTTSIAMTISGRPRPAAPTMVGAGTVFAIALILGGLRPNLILVSMAAFVALGSTPPIVASVQTAVHRKVPPHLMGTAIGMKNAVTGTAHMIGNLSAGVLGAIFVPLVGRKQVHSPALSAVVGNGGSRGFAVLMIAMGIAAGLATFIASRRGRLTRWQELPDVTPEDRVATASPVPAPAPPVSAALPTAGLPT